MTSACFRSLIIAAVVCMVLGAAVDFAFPSLLPNELSRVVDELPLPPAFSSLGVGIAAAVWAIAEIASLIGVFLYKSWGRVGLLACTVVGFSIYPAFGPAVSSWASQALTEATSMLLGAILALSYFGPVRERFEQPNAAV